MSRTTISSARRIGSYNGRTRTAGTIWIDDVRAARAVARIIGDRRYPSACPWCSQTTAATAPRLLGPAGHLERGRVELCRRGAGGRRTHVESQGEHQAWASTRSVLLGPVLVTPALRAGGDVAPDLEHRVHGVSGSGRSRRCPRSSVPQSGGIGRLGCPASRTAAGCHLAKRLYTCQPEFVIAAGEAQVCPSWTTKRSNAPMMGGLDPSPRHDLGGQQ